MKTVFSLVCIGVFFVAISCGVTTGSGANVDKGHSFDTIRYVSRNTIIDSCSALNSYHRKFGVMISDFYVVQDSLPINLDYDNDTDTVVVLSPLSLEPMETSCNHEFDTSPKRLLVEIIVENGESTIRGVYSNLVSDVGGVLSHYSGLSKTENGFKVVHEAGAKYSWLYSVEFAVKGSKLTLEKISKSCSYEEKKKEISYEYNHTSLEKLNIPDTLKNQCNCDEIWSILEKR